MESHIKLVIFDLDGTLVDSLAELLAAANHVRNVFGLPMLDECEVREMLGRGGRLIEKILPKAGPEEIKKAHKEYLSYSEDHLLTSTSIYPGVTDALKELNRKGVLMAIISNKHSMLSMKVLKNFDIHAYFSSILGPDTLPFCKPSPEPILKLLCDFHIDAHKGVIVGDSFSDIIAGRSAGVMTVGCSYGYGKASELTHADYCISNIQELLRLPLFGCAFSGWALEKNRPMPYILKGSQT